MKTALALPRLDRVRPDWPYEVISRWPDADVHFLTDSLGRPGALRPRPDRDPDRDARDAARPRI
jgi:hypothetical protein